MQMAHKTQYAILLKILENPKPYIEKKKITNCENLGLSQGYGK